MKKFAALSVSALAVSAGAWLYSSSRNDLPGREVRIKGGRTAISFATDTLKDRNLAVEFNHLSDEEDCDTCSLPGFKIQDSNLRFRVVDGKIASFDSGKASHKGNFKVTAGGKSFSGKELAISKQEDGLSLTVNTGKGEMVAFDLADPRNLHRANQKEIVLQDMEVRISKELADELGDENLIGSSVGTLTVFAEAVPEDGDGELDIEAYAPESVGLDVSLSAMSNLAVASNPTAKVGTYPTGRTGLTMSTTSCNVGTVNIQWNAPMQTTHPVIALNVYRQLNGRFEHVGWSWLKHGFLSTNSGGCGTCQHPGTGSLLGLGCSDTYGTGNNADRQYLGPRDEVNPLTGVWTCTNSWFSNYQNDCIRRNPAASVLDAVDHRIDCLDEDLNDGGAGARYFYEAYYITPNDINTYNNLGYREASLSWTGSNWSINWQVTNMVSGPAINRWGDLRTTAQPQTDGDAIVAVQVTNNGNGTWHYEYAVYNHTLDRGIREFSIPMPYGAQVTNIGFRDIDRDANNGWTATQSDHALTWTSPTFGNPNGNPLKYSSIFNFRFDSNVPPASTTNTMGLYKPGTLPQITAATTGPLFIVPPTSYSLVNGTPRGGNLASLEDSDDDKLVLGPADTSARSGTGISGSWSAPAGTINLITIGVESSNTLTVGGGASQTVELWNWNTNAYEIVDTRAATVADSKAIIAISTNAGRFVNTTTREVRGRVLHNTNLGEVGSRWTMSLDQVGVHFN